MKAMISYPSKVIMVIVVDGCCITESKGISCEECDVSVTSRHFDVVLQFGTVMMGCVVRSCDKKASIQKPEIYYMFGNNCSFV